MNPSLKKITNESFPWAISACCAYGMAARANAEHIGASCFFACVALLLTLYSVMAVAFAWPPE